MDSVRAEDGDRDPEFAADDVRHYVSDDSPDAPMIYRPIATEFGRHLRPHLACQYFEPTDSPRFQQMSETEQAAIEGHIAACAACQRRQKALDSLN